MEQYALTSDKGTTYRVKGNTAQLTLSSGFGFPIRFTEVRNLPPEIGEKVEFEFEGSPIYTTHPIIKVEKIA